MTRWWDNLCAVDITSHVLGALRLKHPAPEWAVFDEFSGGTGTSLYSGSTIDLLAVHLWHSRKHKGGHVIAYEVKASRSDFARELQNPEKRLVAEKIASDCFFAVPAGLVRVDEVPESWGLVEVLDNSKTRVTKQAQQRDLPAWPWPVLQSFARRMHRAERPQDEDASRMGTVRREVLWRLAGLELTEDEIAHVVEQHYGWQIKSARNLEREHAFEKFRESAEYLRLQAIETAVREAMNHGSWHSLRVDDVKAWLAGKGAPLNAHLRHLLRALRDGCDAVLKEEPDGLAGKQE